MKWAAVAAGLLLIASVGCTQRATGPSVADYERAQKRLAARVKGGAKKVLAKRSTRHRGRPKQQEGTEEVGLGTVEAGYHYDPTGKRDPFRSFVLQWEGERARHERGPLEQFDLTQLSVVAVVWGTQRPRAVVQDPSGRTYVVAPGTAIGKNGGKVVRISDGGVWVREAYVDYLGDRTTKEIELPVHQSQGG